MATVESLRTERLELVPFAPKAIRYLVAGDRAAAQGVLGLNLPPEFPTDDELRGFLPIQLKRMQELPGQLAWLARLMVARNHELVGHCGFHGPPAVIGRAEVGYTVFGPYRGRGFAKEAATALVQWAFEQGESEVFASVAPSNAPSLAVVRALGFTQVGVQEDDVDGTELVFSIEANARRSP